MHSIYYQYRKRATGSVQNLRSQLESYESDETSENDVEVAEQCDKLQSSEEAGCMLIVGVLS